ncbi:hypothetical protein ACLX1H_007125 [Fusarium chlamydosporum]
MAHQAERLPWQSLASVFELRAVNPCQHDAPDLHPRDEPEKNAPKLCLFRDSFLKSANLDAQKEREKYPGKFDPLNTADFFRSLPGEECDDESLPAFYYRAGNDETILTDGMVNKITPTVRRWYPKDRDGSTSSKLKQGLLCPHTRDSDNCECALSFRERQLAAFQREYAWNDCWEFEEKNGEAYRNLEFVKSLMLVGEMDPILRVCSSDECHLGRWWEASECGCMNDDLGWNMLCEYAITMYLSLNILYCFPETWRKEGLPIDDYRDLRSYRKSIRHCTISSGCRIATYPHRDFFGIEEQQFRYYPVPFDVPRWKHVMYLQGGDTARNDSDISSRGTWKLKFYPYGLMTYDEFLSFEKPVGYKPHAAEVSQVKYMLVQKSLPEELAENILSEADYVPGRSLPVAGKPLHPGNKTELDLYLEECWQLIVRCVMLGRELEDEDFEFDKHMRRMFKECLKTMFQCDCDKNNIYNFDD